MKIRFDGRSFAAGLLLWACGAALAAVTFDMSELMALLAKKRSGEASFVEQRFVKGLDQPLRSSGTLSFVAPDRFTRSTLEPRAESVSVEGNNVTMKRGGRSRSLTLDAAPEAAAIVDAIRGTMTGNTAALQRNFRPAFGGNAEQWVLDLTPLDVALYNQVRIVRIMGRHSDVLSVEVQLADGDGSVMSITPEPAARAASAP